ncbi:hypothetical protein J1N35_002033 [Gossypium stocksii]|uniref:Reverse transcriptase zinc-binding domain-containing protein n=1 Tax=Gossypium stocksii TaxID=47602 RepID=A0A9D3WKZ4_9ROSI|nr:hypothetical protein J1N35_002033 [Gossypium stocksii]
MYEFLVDEFEAWWVLSLEDIQGAGLPVGEASSWHLHTSDRCPRCGLEVEPCLNMLSDCGFVMNVWNVVVPLGLQVVFFTLPLQQWLLHNLENENNYVWKNRNDPVFNEGHDSCRDVVVTSLARAPSLSNHKVQQLHVFVDYELSATWCPLQDGWVKLNWNVSVSVVTAESPIGVKA